MGGVRMINDASRSDEVLHSFSEFVSEGCGIKLYDYQLQPARAILESIRFKQRLTIVLDFPILSGKDELLAQLEIYLMRMLNDQKMRTVVVNYSDENNLTAVMRLGDRLNSNVFTSFYWKMVGLDFVLGEGRTIFYSMQAITIGEPIQSNLLLIVNEAQNVDPDEYDRLNEMFTSDRGVTRIICGTNFGGKNLLNREIRCAIIDEQEDGIKRLYKVTEEQARKENKTLDFKMANIEDLCCGKREEMLRSMFFSG